MDREGTDNRELLKGNRLASLQKLCFRLSRLVVGQKGIGATTVTRYVEGMFCFEQKFNCYWLPSMALFCPLGTTQ